MYSFIFFFPYSFYFNKKLFCFLLFSLTFTLFCPVGEPVEGDTRGPVGVPQRLSQGPLGNRTHTLTKDEAGRDEMRCAPSLLWEPARESIFMGRSRYYKAFYFFLLNYYYYFYFYNIRLQVKDKKPVLCLCIQFRLGIFCYMSVYT